MLGPLFCDRLTAAPLLPKLRGHFAEFLNNDSLVRLRIFSSSTCVGLRYGLILTYLATFLASVNSSTSLLVFTPRHHPAFQCVYFTAHQPHDLDAAPSPRFDYPSVSLLHLCVSTRYRNIYLLSITYAFRPRLSPRLTLGGRTFPRKPQTFDGGVSRSSLATYAGILSCVSSTASSDTASANTHCSSTDRITPIPKLRCQV